MKSITKIFLQAFEIAGAALYQESFLKFDKWAYSAESHSYDEQNTLLYFIK